MPYPDQPLDDPDALAPFVGEYWTRWYGDADFCRRYLRALTLVMRSVHRVFGAATSRAGWEEIPLHEPMAFLPIAIRESQVNASPSALLRFDRNPWNFGATASFDDYPPYIAAADEVYVDGGYVFRHPAPARLVSVKLLANGLVTPTASWHQGIDYILAEGDLVFRANPFLADLFAIEDVYDDTGTVVDRQITLWGHEAALDRRWLSDLLGSVVGVEDASSVEYHRFLLAAMQSTTAGSSAAAVRAMFESAIGVPLAQGDETVEAIGTDRRQQVVWTDKNVYLLPLGSELAVAVGDVLTPAASLCSAFRLDELHRGQVPPGLHSLSLGPEHLGLPIRGLVFDDAVVPIDVEATQEGLRTEFTIGGSIEDVALFWDTVHARGVAAGRLLSSSLDPLGRNPAPVGSIPATINPLEFLLANVLRGPIFICQIRPVFLASENLSRRLGWLQALRQSSNPWGGFFLILILPRLGDRIDPANEDTELGPGMRDGVGVGPALGPVPNETISGDVLVRDSFRFRIDTSACATE